MTRLLLLPFFCLPFFHAAAQEPALQWVDEFACSDGAGVYSGQAVRVHALANGDVLQLSWLRGTWDLDPGPVEELHSSEPYPTTRLAVARYDGQGALLWSWSLGKDPGYTVAMQATELPDGDVLIVGATEDTLDIDPGPNEHWLDLMPNTRNIWLARYTSAGELVWGRIYPSAGGAFPYRVATDASGAIWICGIFNTTLDLGNGVVLGGGQYTDGFMAKLDPEGNALWGHAVASGLNDNYVDLAVSTDGQYVYLAGNYSGTVDFDPGPGTVTLTEGSGTIDGFLTCLDTAGTLQWAHTLGGPVGYAYPQELEAVEDGFIVAGGFTGSAQVDPLDTTFHVTPVGNWVGLSLARYNSDGGLAWFNNLALTGGGGGPRMTCTESGDPVVAWFVGGTLDVDPGANVVTVGNGVNTESVMVCYHGSDGSYAWDKLLHGPGTQELTDVASLRDHGFWACGQNSGGAAMADTVAVSASDCYTGVLIKYLRCDTIVITAVNNVLTATPGDAYQWSLDGAEIPDATEMEYEPLENGNYTVTVSDVAGCVITSAPYTVLTTGIAEVTGPRLEWRDGRVYLPRAASIATVRVLAGDGSTLLERLVPPGGSVDLRHLAAAMYVVTARDRNGTTFLRVAMTGSVR